MKTKDKKFAIIKTGGKEYKVQEGQKLRVEKLSSPKGKIIQFADILSGGKVSAKILLEGKSPKIRVLKFRPKKRYHKVYGHRQPYTQIEIEKIT